MKKNGFWMNFAAWIVSAQSFPVWITYFLGNMYENATLFAKWRHIPLLQWSDKWLGCLYSMDVDALLAHYKSDQGIKFKKSNIPHPDAVLNSFTSRTIGRGEIVRYYHGSLHYTTLLRNSTIRRRMGRHDARDYRNVSKVWEGATKEGNVNGRG